MILIGKVSDPFGWLGNMAPFPCSWEGKDYRTTEALFQCLRFDDQEICEAIRVQKSPMGAKMTAKKNRERMGVPPMSQVDLQNMRLCLTIKIEQHPALKDQLIATGDDWIVEDCSRRPNKSGLFWGAAIQNGEWTGENWLGVLWMELREVFTRLPTRKELENARNHLRPIRPRPLQSETNPGR